MIRVRLKLGAGGEAERPGEHGDAQGAGGPRGFEVVQGIADERDLVRLHGAMRREGQHHAGVRFSPEPGIVARHEIEIRIEAERRGLRAG